MPLSPTQKILARVAAGVLTVVLTIGLIIWAYLLGTDATRWLTQQQDSAPPCPTSPNWTEITTGIGTALLVATAIIAAWFAYFQIRQVRESRHAETFTTVLQRWNDYPFRDVRMKIRTYVGAGGSQGLMDKMLELRNKPDIEYWDLLAAGDFFEDVAMLVKYGAISMDMADRRFGHIVCEYWSMLGPFVIWYRKTNNNPTWLTEFETLAREISVMNWYPFPWVFPGGWGAGAPPTPGGWPEPTKEEISREAKAIDIGTHPAG